MRKLSRVPVISDYVSSPGDRRKTVFTPRFNGTRVSLVESGVIDVQDAINAHAPFCDIRYMLSRLKVGDSSVLSPNQPTFGDFTGFPRNPVDALNLVHDVERSFGQLDESIRSSCNNDWRIYFAKLINGDFNSTPGSDPVVSAPSNIPSSNEVT